MRKAAALLFLVLLALPAFAGGPRISTTDNGLLPTSSAIGLFVDPTGSDSNICTSSGTAACLTIQGAVNKLLPLKTAVRNLVTVSIAPGTYAGATVSGFTCDPSFQKAVGAGILFDGALANVTPTTGSATGTATAGTAGGTPITTGGTLTDSGATWTVNDPAMVGKFVVITGGTGSGQVRVIVSNTATVLSVAGTWTAPTGTSTYALQSPSVIVNTAAAAILTDIGGSSVLAAGFQVINNNCGVGAITFRNISVSTSTTSAPFIVVNSPVSLVQVLSTGATAAGSNFITRLGAAVIVDTAINATGGFGISCGSTGAIGGGLDLRRSLVTTTTFDAIQISGGCTAFIANTYTNTNAGIGFKVQSGASINLQSGSCNCNSGANTTCASAANASANNATSLSGGMITSQGIDVTNCATGVSASGMGQVNFLSTSVLSGNALVYGVEAYWGGQVVTPATVTLTAVTAEMNLDLTGAQGTFASRAAKFSCLASLETGSKICR